MKKEIKQEDEEEEVEKIEPTLNADEKPNEPMKKKRGRPKGSIKSLNNEKNPVNVEIKEEKQEISSILNTHEPSDVLIKKKPGRQKSITKQPIDADMKSEEIEMTPNDYENLNESMKKKRGRPRSSVRSIKNEKTDIETEVKSESKDEVIAPARRGRKRKIVTDENSNDEDNDTQNEESFVVKGNLSTRRSARPRKSVAAESTSTGNSRTPSQV